MSQHHQTHPFDLDALRFVPQDDTVRHWAKTRKKPMDLYGIKLPGLFRIDEFWGDSLAFGFVILFELGGIVIMTAKVNNALPMIIATVCGFLIDGVCAIVHHNYTMGISCINRNKIVIADITAEEELRNEKIPITDQAIRQRSDRLKAKYELEINKRKRIALLSAFFIAFIALIKIIVFWLLQKFRLDTTTLFVFIVYGLTAFIHIYQTGYCVYGWICRFAMSSSIKSFIKGDLPEIQPAGEPNTYEQVIITSATLPEATDKFHRIEAVSSERYNNDEEFRKKINLDNEQLERWNKGENLYLFRTHSILSDGALQRLAARANNTPAQQKIILTGLYIQLLPFSS
jgi:hypothetical protein